MSAMLLKTPDAAKRLGVSEAFLEKHRCSGTGPAFVKLGRAVAYREVDLDQWVAARVRTSTSEQVPVGGAV